MRRLAVLLVASLLALSACTGNRVVHNPGVDVDTQELRATKAQAGIAPCEESTAPKSSKGLPDVELPCLGGGRAVNLASLRGPMVVNLWAQWCKPCRTEMKYYQALHERYGDKLGMLGVDWQDTQPLLALRLARENGVTYPLVADTEGAVKAPGLPRLVLLDAAGRIAYDEYLEIKSEKQLQDLVEKHLGISP